jgi:predicted Zn-dependent protease
MKHAQSTVSQPQHRAVPGSRICILAVFLCLSLLAGCATNPVTGKSELMLVTEEQEIQMGKELYPNAMWGAEGGGGEYKDERLKAYLSDVVTRIHRSSHRPNLPVSFAVQNSSVPNAWAIPGYVVITRGLLAGIDNEAEFAFVMGHEMGHVSARHSARQITNSTLLQVSLGIAGVALSGTDYADSLLGLGTLGGSLLLLKCSRDDELEADRIGVQYMMRIGYDANGAVTAHQNLQRVSNDYVRSLGKEPQEQSWFENLLSTHPRTQVRIEEIQEIISDSPRSPVIGDGRNRAQFQNLTANLRNTNRVYANYYDKAVRAFGKGDIKEANNLISQAIAADRSQPPFYALAGYIFMKQKNLGEAERYFNGALTVDPNYQPAYRGIGTLRYAEGNFNDAARYLNKSLSLFPQDAVSHYFLGMGYYKQRSYKAAIPHLTAFSQAKPNHTTIHGVLAQCYESVGDQKSAYNQYLAQMKAAPGNDMGKQAAERAAALKPIVEPPPTREKEKK